MRTYFLNGALFIALVIGANTVLFAQAESTNSQPLATVKLLPKIRASAIQPTISEIPLNHINNFLLRNRVVEPGVLGSAPHVIAGEESRVILSTGDTIYARGDFSKSDGNYGIYRPGQAYVDPNTEEVLGIQAIDIGGVQMSSASSEQGTFLINRSNKEIRVSDRLLLSQQRQIQAVFTPTPPKTSVSGVIMNIETGVSQAGKFDIIAVNLGSRDDMEQGTLLGIYQKGDKIKDRNAQKNTSKSVTLPDNQAGLVMVFQVFEKMSLAIVLEAERGVALEDYVRNP